MLVHCTLCRLQDHALRTSELHPRLLPQMHDTVLDGLLAAKDAQTRTRALHMLQALLAAGRPPAVPQWGAAHWSAFVELYR